MFSALEVTPGLPDAYQRIFGWGSKPDGTSTYHLRQLSLLRRAQGLPSGIGV